MINKNEIIELPDGTMKVSLEDFPELNKDVNYLFIPKVAIG